MFKCVLYQEQNLETALASLQAEERAEAEATAALEAKLKLEQEQMEAARMEQQAKQEVKEEQLTKEQEAKEGWIPPSAETRLVHIDKQKHKNLLKKHCSLM